MSEFINTIDVLGDDAVVDSIIQKTITEFKDDQVTEIGQNAFYRCNKLENVELPNATIIGASAFEGCASLAEINLPNVSTIGQRAFWGCASLGDVVLPNATEIQQYGFRESSITSIVAPKLISLGQTCFTSCKSLKILDFGAVTKLVGGYTFESVPIAALIIRTNSVCELEAGILNNSGIGKGTGYIYVPAALVDSYKAATNWSVYADQFRALEDYTVDGTTTGELDETKI